MVLNGNSLPDAAGDGLSGNILSGDGEPDFCRSITYDLTLVKSSVGEFRCFSN